MNWDTISFDQFRFDPLRVAAFPFNEVARGLIWKSSVTDAGQWQITQEERELLALYTKESVAEDFLEACLFSSEEGHWSKGTHYFKEYPKKYGFKQFSAFLGNLSRLLEQIGGASFEEEDRELRLKALLVLMEEIIDHLCWGIYLCYQAGGVCESFSHKTLTPTEIEGTTRALLLSASFYLEILTKERLDMSRFLESLHACFLPQDDFSFISNLASKGSRESFGSFFSLRLGCHELKNAVHALRTRHLLSEKKETLDFLVAPFFDSLSSAAFLHAALSLSPSSFLVHAYDEHVDHVKCGEWDGMLRREMMNRLSKIPPLIRPYGNVAGKKTIIVLHTLSTEKTVQGLARFYSEMGAHPLYITSVEAAGEKEGPSVIPKAEVLAPSFAYAGPLAIKNLQKKVCSGHRES